VRLKKTEYITAWFKGVDAVKDQFICRPVVGYSRGLFPRFAKGAVYKQKVFGVGVFEERGRRNRWERMKAETQDRFGLKPRFSDPSVHVFIFILSLCNLAGSWKRQAQQCTVN
jgi:hypothetical protein